MQLLTHLESQYHRVASLASPSLCLQLSVTLVAISLTTHGFRSVRKVNPWAMPEHANRRIYLLLAELFLDSELTPDDARILANAIRSTKFPIDDIEHKIRSHLFPVLYPNLLSASGQWAGFDEEWLLHEVENTRRKQGSYFHDIWNNIWWYICGGAVMSRWETVKRYLQRPEETQSIRQRSGKATKSFVNIDSKLT